ncbi:transposase [Clostridium thermarum]|uniref:transposase n=1 Tax=Clostridium thermarum TaxID=1716543 RepID=UPI001122D93A|nr:transposase [Clostridium thermarum]
MPRCARVKSNEYTYHIICRSISEIDLFRDNDDKVRYMELIKKYQTIFNFKIYAYCLMDNHLHILLFSNGSDISKIMHGINQSYSQYYNHKYARHGHVFQDRFKSKVVDNDRYMFVLSLYIHNNAKDLKGIKSIYKYEFSSLPVYLGLSKDRYNILDPSVILTRLSKDKFKAISRYTLLVNTFKPSEENVDNSEEFDYEIYNNIIEYRSEKVKVIQDIDKHKVIEYLSELFSMDAFNLRIKHLKSNTTYKALTVIMLRGLCDMTIKEICEYLGDVTQSHISKLCSKGYELINSKYQYIIKNFIVMHTPA